MWNETIKMEIHDISWRKKKDKTNNDQKQSLEGILKISKGRVNS